MFNDANGWLKNTQTKISPQKTCIHIKLFMGLMMNKPYTEKHVPTNLSIETKSAKLDFMDTKVTVYFYLHHLIVTCLPCYR